MDRLKQQIRFLPLGGASLRDLLGVRTPLLAGEKAHQQLFAVEKYVLHEELGAKSVAIEEHYIDRDYIEDYSVFYSKNLVPIPNYCQRVHFFNVATAEAERALKNIRDISREEEFLRASDDFSKNHYIGFCVIKPLPGCPVGRTVLRCFGKDTKAGFQRDFSCACDSRVHLMGVPLRVSGLAFQQQDLGVSACATTALWSALHRARELEGGIAATPAQITMRAAQYALPFGRSMPSEGLSMDQMCQAVQSLGYAPNLFRAQQYEVSRWVLHSAVRSGISPVLILEKDDGRTAHAVSVAGMKLRHPHEPDPNLLDELARDLISVYIHDDRLGPYMRADIQKLDGRLELSISVPGNPDVWKLSHILVPMHNKIRLSFTQLRTTALWLAVNFQARRIDLGGTKIRTGISSWIEKSTRYVESQIIGLSRLSDQSLETLCSQVPLSRYVGIVRLEAEDTGSVDVLLDTTSTERNLHCLAVVPRETGRPQIERIARFVAERLRCPYLGSD